MTSSDEDEDVCRLAAPSLAEHTSPGDGGNRARHAAGDALEPAKLENVRRSGHTRSRLATALDSVELEDRPATSTAAPAAARCSPVAPTSSPRAEVSDFASQLARVWAEAAAKHAASLATNHPAVATAPVAVSGHAETAPASAHEASSTASAAAAPTPHPLHECLICHEERADTYPQLADGAPCWRSEANPDDEDARH